MSGPALIAAETWALGVDVRGDELCPWFAVRVESGAWIRVGILPIQVETARDLMDRARANDDRDRSTPDRSSWAPRACLGGTVYGASNWSVWGSSKGVFVEVEARGVGRASHTIPREAWAWLHAQVAFCT